MGLPGQQAQQYLKEVPGQQDLQVLQAEQEVQDQPDQRDLQELMVHQARQVQPGELELRDHLVQPEELEKMAPQAQLELLD